MAPALSPIFSPGFVIVHSKCHLTAKVSHDRGADVAATKQQASDGGLSNGAGGTVAPEQNDPEAAAAAAAETVGTPGPKRFSFRRPST